MAVRGLRRIRRVVRVLRKRAHAKALILLYHRVASLDADPQLLSVTPKHFEEQMEFLSRSYHLISLEEIARLIRTGDEIPDHSVAITFDDGYADNLHQAKPIIDKFSIPTTLFITSGFIGSSLEFWWDVLERILLRPNDGPEVVHLSLNGKAFRFHLGPWSAYRAEDAEQHRAWNVETRIDPTGRHLLYRTLCETMRTIPYSSRRMALGLLASVFATEIDARDTHRILYPEELRELAAGKTITIGAHTVTHSTLSALDLATQKYEIDDARRELSETIGADVNLFSYPYGTFSDYTNQTVALVNELGYQCACSNYCETIWKNSDVFQLPRFVVRDWDSNELSSRIQTWFSM